MVIHSYISQSKWQNCKTMIDMDFFNHFNHKMQSFIMFFLTQLTRICFEIHIEIIATYFSKLTYQNLDFFMYAFIFCVHLVTPKSVWHHKGVATLKTKGHQFNKFVITGDTISCRKDKSKSIWYMSAYDIWIKRFCVFNETPTIMSYILKTCGT